MTSQITPEQREARVERRAAIRAAITEKRAELQQWRQARADQATKRAEARRKDRQAAPRGVDRVSARLRGLSITVEPYLTGKHGTVLAHPEDLHPAGNHETRRGRGQRGHQRPPRTRELPGGAQRRLERKRKAWLA